jgi:hypothetical protein
MSSIGPAVEQRQQIMRTDPLYQAICQLSAIVACILYVQVSGSVFVDIVLVQLTHKNK